MKKRRFAARMTAGLLAVLMSVSLPMESLASISATKGNTRSENEKLLETVKAMGMDDTTAEAVCQKLMETGLWDGSGDMVTKSLKLDGRTITLEEARALVEDPDADLERMVTVDGESLSLRDLKVMLEIEDELARIQHTYLDQDIEMTSELQDMLRQFGTDGLETSGFANINSLDPADGTERTVQSLSFGSGIDHTVTLSVRSSVTDSKVVVTFELNKAQNADVTFRVDTVDGSAAAGTDYEAVSGRRLEIKKGGKSVDLTINRLNTLLTDSTERWKGDKGFLVQVSDLVNAVLPEGRQAVSSPVMLTDSFDFSLFDAQREIPYGKATNYSDPNISIDTATYEQKYFIKKGYVDFKLPGDLPGYQTQNTPMVDRKDEYPRNLIKTSIQENSVDVKALLDNYAVISVREEGTGYIELERMTNYSGMTKKFKEEFDIVTTTYPNGFEQMVSYTPDWVIFDPEGNSDIGRKAMRKRLSILYKEEGYDPDKPLEAVYNLSPENRQKITTNNYRTMLYSDCVTFHESYDRFWNRYEKKLEFQSKGGTPFSAVIPVTKELLLVPITRLNWTVSAPSGNYPTGSTLPIIVEFTQPVKASSVVITARDEKGENVQELKPMESSDTISTRLTFPYHVKSAENGDILVSAGMAGENGNSSLYAYSKEKIDWILKDKRISCGEGKAYKDTYTIQDALSPLQISKDSYTPEDKTARITMKMPEDPTLRTMLLNGVTADGEGGFLSGSFGISMDGGVTIVPFKFVDESGAGTSDKPVSMAADITLQPNSGEKPVSEAAELYLLDGEGHAQSLQLGYYQTVTRNPAVYLLGADLEIVYPSGSDSVFKDEMHPDNTVFAGDPPKRELLKLDFNIGNERATWKNKETDFKWSSSNESIAVIDPVTGQISLTGGIGEVTFTLMALNGGNNQGDLTKYQAVTAKSLVAIEGNNPYLSIPDSLNKITVKTGTPVTVRWATNLFDKNGQAPGAPATSLTLKVYKAEYGKDGSLLPIDRLSSPLHTETVTGTREKPVYQYEFNGLEKISLGTQASYVVTVESSSVEGIPGVIGGAKEFMAQALVYVRAKPATVKLTKPENLFLTTEAGTVRISWTVDNLDRINQGEFALTVTDNDTGNQVISLGSSAASKDQGEVILDLKTKDFCTIYTVEAKARNGQDDAWSRDSYVLYVYDADALKILVDGEVQEDNGRYTLSNRDKISNLYQKEGGQKAILDLERDINLQKVISINYGEYAWTELADRMQWKVTSDNEEMAPSASVNYRLGSQYRNINGLPSQSYAPTEEFMLSGSRNGVSKVTVNHALAGAGFSKDLEVDVKSLTDKLYLFQFYPEQETTVTYTRGDGSKGTVTSEADGRAAIYEESGIKGEIFLKATAANGSIYLGTLYADQLNSGERDAASMELYPLNNMVLRKQGEVPVSFKKPDGTAYTGQITIRGGILLNGKYIEKVGIDQNHPGTEDYTLNLGKTGSHTFTFDLTQGNLDVKEEDQISFLLEIRPEDSYYPVFLEYNGRLNEDDAVKLGEGIVNLETVPEGGKNQPFIATQRLRFGENRYAYSESIKGRKGKIGPSTSYPKAYIETNVLWWGTKAEAGLEGQRAVSLIDQDGKTPDGQTSELVEYAFSTMPLTRNTLCLDKTNLESWGIGSLETRGLTLKYIDQDGSIRKKEDLGVRVMNAFDIENAASSAKLKAMLGEIGQKAGGGKDKLGELGSGFISVGIAAATNVGVETPFLKLKLAPTSDPTVFKGLVFVGANNMTDDNISGMDPDLSRRSDLDYMPSLFDIMEAKELGGVGNYASTKGKQLDYAGNILSQNRKQGQAAGSSKNSSADGSVAFNLTGYFESEVYYDYDDGQWKMEILNGGLTVGGGYGYDWSWNWFVGPVPVIAQIGLGASVLADYRLAANHMAQGSTDMDYLLDLRVMAYIRAFGGIGFDYAIVAMKVGLFGQVTLDARMDFLWRHDRENLEFAHNVKGTGTIGIEFAVKVLFFSYEAVLWGTTINLGKTQSDNWNSVQRYWEEVGKGLSGNEYTMMTSRGGARMAMPVAYNAEEGTAIYAIQQEAHLESREYLDQYERSWEGNKKNGGFFSRLRRSAVVSFFLGEVETPTTDIICDNAYPYAEPKVSDDGKLMVLLTDQEDTDVTKTRAAYTTETKDGGYGELRLIDDGSAGSSYGDSQLSMAGTGDFAVAAWSRVTEKPFKTEGGSPVTEAEQAAMLQSTDIMASVYHDGTWDTIRLTDAAGADMAPVTATAQIKEADGTTKNRAIVAWRSVAGTDENKLTTFDAADDILYRVYDGTQWSGARRIYNGTSGAVMGIQAAMMPDGTAAVTYTVDTGIEGSGGETAMIDEETGVISSGLELFYSVINTNSVVEEWNEEENRNAGVDPLDGTVRTVRLTNDTYADENPQVTVVKIGEEERFILGWHSIQSSDGTQKEDIRLRSINEKGLIDNQFPNSLSELTMNSDTFVSGNFQFSRGAETIDQLSVLWKQAAREITEAEQTEGTDTELMADHDLLNGIRFCAPEMEGGSISVTAAQTLYEMGPDTTIDTFSGYVADDGSLKTIVLGTVYDQENQKQIEVSYGYDEEGRELTGNVIVPGSKAVLYRVGGSYTENFAVDSVIPEYTSIYAGAKVPLQVSVRNMGTKPVNRVTMQVGGKNGQTIVWDTAETDSIPMKAIAPGEARMLVGYYQVPDTISNASYQATAMFEGDKTAVTADEGTLILDVPDLGISGLRLTGEENGKRIISMNLYNSSQSRLSGAEDGRYVKVGIYKDAECTQQIESEYLEEITTRTAAESYLKCIDAEEDLAQIDAGSYTLQYQFDVAKYIRQHGTDGEGNPTEETPYASESGEIRDGGINLYVKAWIEQMDKSTGETGEMIEYCTSNNGSGIRVRSLLEQADGEPVSMSVTVSNEEEQSSAVTSLLGKLSVPKQNTASGTRADIILQNNSIQQKSSGNLIATLYDDKGAIIETKQLYDPTKTEENFGLITMGAEEKVKSTIQFSQKGQDVKVRYTDEMLEAGGDKLAALDISILKQDEQTANGSETENVLKQIHESEVESTPGTYMITLMTENAESINVEAEAENKLQSGITLNGGKGTNGIAIGSVPVRPGTVSQIIITVDTPVAQEDDPIKKRTYIINVVNRRVKESQKGQEAVMAPGGQEGGDES
ncbi:MAG: hypothetical protein LUH21_20805 [Clostridiales bacterium]|nr:hypothetical protein [Clostridiales bacterium]